MISEGFLYPYIQSLLQVLLLESTVWAMRVDTIFTGLLSTVLCAYRFCSSLYYVMAYRLLEE